jgi:hypothetical protein
MVEYDTAKLDTISPLLYFDMTTKSNYANE